MNSSFLSRRGFLTSIALLTLGGILMKNFKFKNNKKQPLLFFGHGSPMNAIEDNNFSKAWQEMATGLSPQAILVVSAHWETYGTKVFSGDTNKMIYDFYGFPPSLSQVQYPAPANPNLAKELAQNKAITLDNSWGLDHGAWSVLVHAFSKANIPVIQLSLNKNLSLKEHFEFAKELSFLRDQGVLVVASGNIVHNLREIDWSGKNTYDWAQKTQEDIINNIQAKDFYKVLELINTSEFKRSHPTVEHFVPLLYTLAMADKDEEVVVKTPLIELGSISMANFLIR